MKNFIILLIAFLMFLGCANNLVQPVSENFNQKEFIVSNENTQNRLFVILDQNNVRFILIDMFGTPLADKLLSDGKFTNLKFLPPNSEHDALFTAMLQILKTQAKTAVITTKKHSYKIENVS